MESRFRTEIPQPRILSREGGPASPIGPRSQHHPNSCLSPEVEARGSYLRCSLSPLRKRTRVSLSLSSIPTAAPQVVLPSNPPSGPSGVVQRDERRSRLFDSRDGAVAATVEGKGQGWEVSGSRRDLTFSKCPPTGMPDREVSPCFDGPLGRGTFSATRDKVMKLNTRIKGYGTEGNVDHHRPRTPKRLGPRAALAAER